MSYSENSKNWKKIFRKHITPLHSTELGSDILIIFHSEEEFNMKCQEKNHDESIHFLKLSNDNENLIWQKSSGPISDSNEFIIKKE